MAKRTLIEITETRAIAADRDNWMIMKRNKRTDKETGDPIGGYTEWHSYKYPSSFERCAAYLEEELIRTCGASTLTELRRLAERIHEMIQETLKEGKLL